MEQAMAVPFSIDAYGAVTLATTQEKIWADRVRSVLGTNFNERIMRPTFGSLIPSAFMETTDEARNLIQAEVRTAFSTQLDQLQLENVSTSYDEYSDLLIVTVLYALPDDTQAETTISLITLDGTNPAIEENI
jgi:phage baseplate assembly protein W